MLRTSLLAAVLIFLVAGFAGANAGRARHHADHHHADHQTHEHRGAAIGHGAQRGAASVVSPRLNGRRTASGRRFHPGENVAASKTLPLGSKARVTNLHTGRSATVEVVDRGPYVRGRIIDLSPAAASELGMDPRGTTNVSVEPIQPPQ
ncbi:Endolytic peptidoglycan transglycosylase RlpA [Rhodovastum atsumiense]|uniref:Endolytic peptidoglycan transglycosylase RlpA n=1 Tax=Rhodovastum atsumiense TaxID=504468 RepID=A0A5M6IK15_9PROT|nr:septal ring lytic transglycosylase RlpA family protein [Rhodovastum atsumiense]KAA5608237.1 septal ring lytic transglycosylase RlpA family protein [Rhodovastum atsumiense]CAH2602610.1 Endolytic peptidoglycan transglycosylase RlpA [Rhodovastum atsumiense]